MPKTVILLASFREMYPGIREDIARFMLDNPGDFQLKDFLFELLEELGPKE